MTSTTRLLKAALLAIANLDAIRAANSAADIAEFPYFADLMLTAGEGLDWMSYKATSADGYITTLWRITGANSVSNRDAPRGPILLQHGMYSDGTAWMERTDSTSAAFPIKLH